MNLETQTLPLSCQMSRFVPVNFSPRLLGSLFVMMVKHSQNILSIFLLSFFHRVSCGYCQYCLYLLILATALKLDRAQISVRFYKISLGSRIHFATSKYFCSFGFFRLNVYSKGFLTIRYLSIVCFHLVCCS
jgi:NADH:ubiquinone oxidoreductase subunit F (NADH-binding)